MSTEAEPKDEQAETRDEEKKSPASEEVPSWFTEQMGQFKSLFQSELNALKAAKAEEPKAPGKSAPTATKSPKKSTPADTEDPTSEYEQRIVELARERDEALRKAEVTLQKATLIQSGLRSPRFAAQILSEYDGTEDFETFVEKCKKDKDLSLLFNVPAQGGAKEPAPSGPSAGSGARTGNTKSAEAQLREFAEGMWPHDKRKQDAYIKNRMAMEKRG